MHLKLTALSFVFTFCGVYNGLSQTGQLEMRGDSTSRLQAGLEIQGIATNKNRTPFWLRTNSFGSNPVNGLSGSTLAYIGKDYRYNPDEGPALLDWGFVTAGRLNVGNKTEFLLTEAYAKARVSIFQLKAGRSRDLTGLVDSSLSSGAFSVSGNGLGVPKVELGIPEYWQLPFMDQLLAVKGNFSHGWFGDTELRYNHNAPSAVSYYHQKSLYGRLGKPHWRLKLFGGFNHQVMWSDGTIVEGASNTLSLTQTFWHVVFGKAYGNHDIPLSKIGNHLGSLDQGVEYDFDAVNIMGYHQFFYEVGGLYHGNNLKDGLWGIVIKNKYPHEGYGFTWGKLLLEYMGSKSQGGELDAPITPSGDEDYYNNYIYAQGWTYKGDNIGSNFLTQRKYARPGQATRPAEIIINNRVKLYHIGAEGAWGGWSWRTKLSFSKNFGTYASSPEGTTTGPTRAIQPGPYFERVRQFSGYLEAGCNLKNNYRLGFVFAADHGMLLNNSVGGILKLSKHW